MRLMILVVISSIIILTIVFIKYKPVYKVTILGEEIGYISNKDEFQKLIENEILNPEEANIAYVDLKDKPTYSLTLASVKDTDESEIYNKIKELSVITYKLYAINVNGENVVYVNSNEEAEETVAKIKEEYKNKLKEINIIVTEEYTQDLNNVENQIETTKVQVAKKVEEEVKKQSSTINGVYFSVKPVSGIITSRYGSRQGSAIVSSNHAGLDIGAPTGTSIKAAAPGKVTYSDWMGGYGYVIIITHENGVKSYYAHCSKLYAKVGDEVEAGDVIAAVGSTGNSTGSHLHFEIRNNGTSINPEKYVY